MRKVVIAGGSGYIGVVLAEQLRHVFDDVVILSRRAIPPQGNTRTVVWDGRSLGEWKAELNEAELLINLTGKNVNCRYTPENKSEILHSRLHAVRVLAQACQFVANPPRTWIQTGSATIYRHAEDRPMDEISGEIGAGFSVDVCKAWEKTFFEMVVPGVRKVLLRTSIVLGKKDGAFPRLVNLARYGLGGKQGDGNQMVSWIHEDDVVKIVLWINEKKNIEGIYNAAAPNPVSNRAFMQILRKAMNVHFGLPAPAWLMKLGAWMIGTETELILKSRWVVPTKLRQAGFSFKFDKVDDAIQDILATKK